MREYACVRIVECAPGAHVLAGIRRGWLMTASRPLISCGDQADQHEAARYLSWLIKEYPSSPFIKETAGKINEIRATSNPKNGAGLRPGKRGVKAVPAG